MKRLVVLALLVGCSGAPLATDFELAHARERAHDDEGALKLYRFVRARCEAGQRRPHDDCALAVVREAQLDEKLGRWRDAFAAWRAVPTLAEEKRKSARALARAAEIAHEELHDDAAALEDARRAVQKYPDEVPSDDALHLLVKIERNDPRALAAELDALYPSVAKTDLGDNVLFERAEVSRTLLEDRAGAVRYYDQLVQTYRRSSLWDDALWRAAQVERELGRPRDALRHLQVLLDSRRDALITGSYNSEFLDDAELEVGRIWLDDLHDAGQACTHFQKLADDYPESILRDDGLYELARAQRTRDDARGACASLARLQHDFPESNRRRQALALAGELGCAP